MQYTTKDIYSWSIHPATGQTLSNGRLSSGTKIVKFTNRLVCMNIGSDNYDLIDFTIEDEGGLLWRERAYQTCLEGAGIKVEI